MAEQPTSSAASLLTPELLQTVAEAIGSALAKQPPAMPPQETRIDHGPAIDWAAPESDAVPSPVPAVQALGAVVAPLARAENRLRSRKLWVAAGTILTLAAQNPLGLALPQAAQVAIAALAAVYVAAQAIVDGARKGGGNG